VGYLRYNTHIIGHIKIDIHLCLIFLATLLLVSTALGLAPAEEWNKTFGGNYNDGAWAVQATYDGGYIIAGHTSSRGMGSDLFVVKADENGTEEWSDIFGGSGEDLGYSIKQTGDGGYVVVGSTKSFGIGDELLWLIKLNPDGYKLWDRTFGGFVSSPGDGGWSVDETFDGGYIITGYTKSHGSGAKDLWILKTDSSGRKVWDKTFGGSKDDVGMSVLRTDDDGYIFTGRTGSYGTGNADIWLLKTNSIGDQIWNRTYGSKKEDIGFQVVKAEDNGYLIVGRTEPNSGKGSLTILIKTDGEGQKLWEILPGAIEGAVGSSIASTKDGGCIIAGRKETKTSGKDVWLIKLNSTGYEEWSLGIRGPGNDIATSVQQARDGGYIVAGITDSYGAGAEDIWLVKILPVGMDQSEISNSTQLDEQNVVFMDMDELTD
jgi:hypothetical protein